MEHRFGICAVCERTYQVTQDGNMRKHRKPGEKGSFAATCTGSDNPPESLVQPEDGNNNNEETAS